MANVVAFMCVIAAVSATYPPQPSNQPQAPPPPPPQPAATAPHTYPSAVQSPPAQQPQGYQPPVRAPVITVYQQSQSPSQQQQQQQQQQQTHGVGNSQAAPSSGGSKLKEILYILPIIQSIDRIQDTIPSLPSGYSIQNQASSGQQQQRRHQQQQQQQQQGYMQQMHYSSSTQQQQQQQQQQQVSGADVNSRTSYGQVNSAMSPVGGQMPSYGSLMAMMASQSAPEAGYGAQSVAPAASHIQLPSSYGSSSSQTSGYELGSSGSAYASQQQQQQMTGYGSNSGQSSASGYGSNQQMVAGSQQMASGYGLAQMSPVQSAVEVGVALKPVLNQQSQYPTISYSQLNNEPKHQQVEVYLATDGQTQGGYQAMDGYESGPNAFDLCEKGFNLDGFCKGKYAGLYSHPNPQCFIQCDQFETHTTSLCAPGTVWLNTGYEPSAVNQCLHSANGITGAH